MPGRSCKKFRHFSKGISFPAAFFLLNFPMARSHARGTGLCSCGVREGLGEFASNVITPRGRVRVGTVVFSFNCVNVKLPGVSSSFSC